MLGFANYALLKLEEKEKKGDVNNHFCFLSLRTSKTSTLTNLIQFFPSKS
jgi:hypothetical protein